MKFIRGFCRIDPQWIETALTSIFAGLMFGLYILIKLGVFDTASIETAQKVLY
jgi:hypothetical protein